MRSPSLRSQWLWPPGLNSVTEWLWPPGLNSDLRSGNYMPHVAGDTMCTSTCALGLDAACRPGPEADGHNVRV